MRRRYALVPLIALMGAQTALAGPGTTPSTTSTTSTTLVSGTTTTTLQPPPCTVEPTFGSAACRLDDLMEHVGTEQALGAMQAKLVRALDRAAAQVDAAEQQCNAGDQRAANKRLKKAVRRLIQYTHRLGSLSARQKISDDALRTELMDAGHDVQEDLVAIKRAGVCPPASPSGAFH